MPGPHLCPTTRGATTHLGVGGDLLQHLAEQGLQVTAVPGNALGPLCTRIVCLRDVVHLLIVQCDGGGGALRGTPQAGPSLPVPPSPPPTTHPPSPCTHARAHARTHTAGMGLTLAPTSARAAT